MGRAPRINWIGLSQFLEDVFINGYTTREQGRDTFYDKKHDPRKKIQQETFLKILMKKYNCSHKCAWEKTQEIVERLPEYDFIIETVNPITIENSNRLKPRKMLVHSQD